MVSDAFRYDPHFLLQRVAVSSIISVALLPQLLPLNWHRDLRVSAHDSADYEGHGGPASHGGPAGRSAATAVVIDTLRFTSTAAVALASGAASIRAVSDIEQARQLGRTLPAGSLLCGERECRRIEGFDLGNSPSEVSSEVVRGRELVYSTTNGTFAVDAARPAHEIILGSLLNRSAVCQWLDRSSTEHARVWCICSGTDGQIAMEDVLTAGAILHFLTNLDSRWQLGNDAALLALASWRQLDRTHQAESTSEVTKQLNARLVQQLMLALGGRNLIEAGFSSDLPLVAQLDSLAVVPRQIELGRFCVG